MHHKLFKVVFNHDASYDDLRSSYSPKIFKVNS